MTSDDADRSKSNPEEALEQVAGLIDELATAREAARARHEESLDAPSDPGELDDRERAIYELGRRDVADRYTELLAKAVAGNRPASSDSDALTTLQQNPDAHTDMGDADTSMNPE